MENGWTAKRTALAVTIGLMGHGTKENTNKATNTAKESLSMQMELFTKANFTTTKFRDMEFTRRQTQRNTLANGSIIKCTGRDT